MLKQIWQCGICESVLVESVVEDMEDIQVMVCPVCCNTSMEKRGDEEDANRVEDYLNAVLRIRFSQDVNIAK